MTSTKEFHPLNARHSVLERNLFFASNFCHNTGDILHTRGPPLPLQEKYVVDQKLYLKSAQIFRTPTCTVKHSKEIWILLVFEIVENHPYNLNWSNAQGCMTLFGANGLALCHHLKSNLLLHHIVLHFFLLSLLRALFAVAQRHFSHKLSSFSAVQLAVCSVLASFSFSSCYFSFACGDTRCKCAQVYTQCWDPVSFLVLASLRTRNKQVTPIVRLQSLFLSWLLCAPASIRLRLPPYKNVVCLADYPPWRGNSLDIISQSKWGFIRVEIYLEPPARCPFCAGVQTYAIEHNLNLLIHTVATLLTKKSISGVWCSDITCCSEFFPCR